MIPDSFKPGMTIYVNMHTVDSIMEYYHIGDGIFSTANKKEDLNHLKWDKMSYSFSEEQAKCKSYLYKLNQLRIQLDNETKKAMKTQHSIDELNKTFGHLKDKYPEEFI